MKSLILTSVLVAAVAMGASLPATELPRTWKEARAKKGDIDLTKVQKMTIGLKRQNMDKMDKVFWEVSDPMSDSFGDHLGHEEMREMISVGATGVSKVTSWLKENGINDFTVARHEDAIIFDVPASKVEELLKVKFQLYKTWAMKGKTAVRAPGRMTIPDAVAPYIELISGHRGFPLIKDAKKRVDTKENLAMHGGSNVTPKTIYAQYNQSYFPTTPKGSMNIQSFAQFQGQAVHGPDLTSFCDELLPELSPCKISKYANGKNEGSEAGIESSLDSEYITATGRATETWAWTYDGSDFCGDLARWGVDVVQTKDGPWTISVSYGLQGLPNYCLGPDVMRFKSDMQKFGTLGISVSISSGDSGSAEYSRVGYNYGLLGPNFLASVPYCTAVGSTTFINGNAGQEEATTAFGSGGGFSFDYAQPMYQQAAVKTFLDTNHKLPPKLSFNASGRATPDISFLGWNFWIISQGQWQPVGGTSCSSPSWAGMVTMLNNIRMENNKTMGFINPFLYANPQGFTDITEGNNDVQGDGMGWYAVKGWDAATGLGTPNWGMLAEAVKSINARERARGVTRKNNKH